MPRQLFRRRVYLTLLAGKAILTGAADIGGVPKPLSQLERYLAGESAETHDAPLVALAFVVIFFVVVCVVF